MKFIVCPFCKSRISEGSFPSSRKGRGHIVMLCPSCKKRLSFTIRQANLNNSKESIENKPIPSLEERIITGAILAIVENRFAYAGEFPLYEGENKIGRYNDKHTPLEVPIHTTDPSMDRIHTTIVAQPLEGGEYNFFIMDENSLTGTFVNNKEVEQGERRELHHGDVLTLGATSILFLKDSVK